MTSGSSGRLANLPLEQLRALLRMAREEGVLQLQMPELAFTLGPKPASDTVQEPGKEPRKLTEAEKLDRDLFLDDTLDG